METNWNQLIERYLNNELSAEGKAAFEAELNQNKELQQEFELHKLTTEIIQRDSLRTMVQASGKWFHLKKTLVNSGLALVIAGVVAAVIYFFVIRTNEAGDKAREQEVLEQSLVEQMEKSLAFANIDPEYFQFTGTSDVFLSESGVLLSITDESFLLDGKPYKGEAIVQWQEAQKAADIVKAGLSTKSGDKLLETQGMFSLNAFTTEGKKLQLTDKGVYVQVPVYELKKDMKLFTGVPGKNGTIDWQNPVELERLPKPKDMAKMDLFPPRYEPKLNELKWFKEKAKRDSLYLSFEEESFSSDSTAEVIEQMQMYNQPKMETPKRISESPNISGVASVSMALLPRPKNISYQVEGTQVPAGRSEDNVQWSFESQPLGNNEAMIIATVKIRKDWVINSLISPTGSFGIPTCYKLKASPNFKLLGRPSEPKPIIYHDKNADEDLYYHIGTIQFKQKIKLISRKPFTVNGYYEYQTSKMDAYCLAPFNGNFSLQMNGITTESNASAHIPPSKVLAIWNKKFNGTNLATQDFEDRMKEIHETCSEKVFDVYAKNLNVPLWELDQRVVKLGYPQFQRFSDQKVGKIKVDDVHQTNLNAFYEKAIETLRETGRKNVELAMAKEEQWDHEVQDERQKEVLRKGIRASLNAQEEADFNLAHIAKQLQQVVGFSINAETVASRDKHWPANLPRVYAKRELPVVVNIDRLTRNLLSSRKAVKVFTMDKVKTAEIQYAEFKANVEAFKDFDRLYFYLFPKQVNSYERRDFVNGKLNHSLNDAMDYSGLAFGLKENGFYLFEIPTLRATDFGSIKLQKVSEKQFETCLNRMNERRGVSPTPINDELNWLFKEKANYQVQQKRRENEQFRNTVRPTIYSCLRTEGAQVDSIQPVKHAIVRNLTQNKKEANEVFDIVDEPAAFPGGMDAFRKFLSDNVQYPERALEKNISGKVTLRLVIGADGKMEEVTPVKEIPGYPEFTAEAIRIVSKVPKFNPGIVNGKPVKSYYRIPITFTTN